jgi:carbon-monoxide dehydrogenase large subunit
MRVAKNGETKMAGFGIGQPIRRVEDKRFLTGHGTYIEDITLPRQAYAYQLLSPHAHARIVRIDKRKAETAPGVLCVLTGADAAAEQVGPMFGMMPEDTGGPKGYRAPRQVLAMGKVRYVGERVAFVVAETKAQAQDAAELVEVDYEALPAVVTPEDAVKDGAPKIWEDCPTGNVAFSIAMGDQAATDAAFAKAAHKVSLRLVNNRLSANSMEMRGSIGDYDAAEDSYTLYTATQDPHGTRNKLAGPIFHVPESQFRVVAKDVGGGFGMKGDDYPEDVLVLWASKKLGRPVKWISTRSEALMTDAHGRDQIFTGEMALDKDGHILAVRVRALGVLGSAVASVGIVPVLTALKMVPAVYKIPTVHLSTQGVFTNTVPLAPYRGAGRPEATYIIERLIEQAAHVLGVDPIELRRRNFIDAFPYTTPLGVTYDVGDFAATTTKCLELADWNGYAARKAASEKRGRLRGRGLIYYMEECGIFNERMELRFDPSGSVTIIAGTFSHGQSHATTFAQLVSDWLGVPFESIRFIQGDTAQVAMGRGTYGARSSSAGGGGLKMATATLIEKAKLLAGHLMEAAPADIQFENGRFTIAGTDKSMALVDVAKAAYAPLAFLLPPGFGVGLEATGFADGAPNYPNGCHICELEIDPDTGTVAVDRYTVVDDFGMVINPLIVEGQIIGGLAQGFGQALLEDVIYDRESGQLLTGSFTDYTMPRADDMPAFAFGYNNIPTKTNAIGIKGAGEAGSVGAPPAVINAVLDALAPLGVKTIDMPATSLRVWETIEAAKAA